MEIRANFQRLYSGHPEMGRHRRWADVIIGELSRLDSNRRWRRLKDEYMLLYSHRTKSHLQELMESTQREAEERRKRADGGSPGE